MPRHPRDDLTVNWKVPIPATVAGRIEHMLADPVHNKPLYGARTKLIAALLEYWIARESGRPADQIPPIPSLLDLREAI